jgi:hypothetical protein
LSLPTTGQTNWGTPLSSYITSVVLATATSASNAIANHSANIPADPHGDRAYSLSLVTPITSGVNQPNGYVQLQSNGLIPNALLPSAGGLSDVYDVSSATYGAVGNGTTDDTTAIQAALTACANAGGGEVWIPNGKWLISGTLLVGNNTQVHMSAGATIIRGRNATSGLYPSVMFSNFSTSTSLSSITGNISFVGGVIDCTTGNTINTACQAINLANASFAAIQQTAIIVPVNNTAISLWGMSNVIVSQNLITTYTPSASTSTAPAIYLGGSNASDLPSGLASSMYSAYNCTTIGISYNALGTPLGGWYVSTESFGGFGYFVGTSITVQAAHSYIILEGNYLGGLCQNMLPNNNVQSWTPFSYITLIGNQFYSGLSSVALASISSSCITFPYFEVRGNTLNLDMGTPQSMTGLSNGWSVSSGVTSPSPQYFLDEDGYINFEGVIQNSSPNQSTFYVMPSYFEPSSLHTWAATLVGGIFNGTPNAVLRVQIDDGGNMSLQGPTLSGSPVKVCISGRYPTKAVKGIN